VRVSSSRFSDTARRDELFDLTAFEKTDIFAEEPSESTP